MLFFDAYPSLRFGRIEEFIVICAPAHVRNYMQDERKTVWKNVLQRRQTMTQTQSTPWEKITLADNYKMVKVFYNCANCDKIEDAETRAFLRYVATKQATTDYTERLEQHVRGLKVTPREQLYYNNWLEITDGIRDEAREEGRREGHLAGIAEGEKCGAHDNSSVAVANERKPHLKL